METINWVPLGLYCLHISILPYPLISLSNPHIRTHLLSLYISCISHSHIHTTIYIPNGPSTFWTFPLYLFYLEGAFDSWKSECSGRICWRMTRWSNDPIALILSYHGDKTHTHGHTGKHTTVEDLHQRSQEVDGIRISFFPLYLFLCLSPLFCVLVLYQSLSIVFILCFCFLSIMFPYLLAAGLRLYNLHFPLFFFFVFVSLFSVACLILQCVPTY